MEASNAPHDNRESDDRSAVGMRFLLHSFTRLTTAEAQSHALTVQPRSSLAGDRDAGLYNPLPDQVQGLLAVALDHLRAVQVTVEDSGGKILAMPLFTLVRSAYESAGTGLWLLQPASRDERLLRSMQLTWDNRRQVRTMITERGGDPSKDEGFTRMDRRLTELLTARPGLEGAALKDLANVTTRLRSIGVLLPQLVMPPLVLWQIASGIAHGNHAMMHSALERRQLTPFVNGSADFEVTSSVVLVAMFYDAALTMVETLLELHAARSRAPGVTP
ncbi:hypothetical protein [Clavibacter sp. VKM Ac-2542]|uniref:hypothetical protein n=1 Tax=Clavibacter sp. VKM Ac-2542 TaxID=2783811 RepID=UPI00188CFD65|nr:hypothetical protein [Clavibacter sp. VKM Ac-2542]MBF4622604.1 hypothetical protein [Clavibacter sp. VKM Ac-2542]